MREVTANAQAIIEMRGVSKFFGELEVLHDLDLTVRRGEKIGLIGTSGSGKSTILRILMGLETIDAGQVLIAGESAFTQEVNGREVAADEAHRRRVCRSVGMVFQHFHLFPHMRALDNVTVAPIHVRGDARDQAEARGLELLDLVGLADRGDAWPAQLSGGQKQRVAIARALAMDPKVLLFDEVTSALDPEVVGEVLAVIRALARQDLTFLIVTHQMGFAEEIADRVLFLDQGRIVESGPPNEIFHHPHEERTQEFLRRILDAR